MNTRQNIHHAAATRHVGEYLAWAGLGLAVLAASAEILTGPGTRLGLWHFRTGLALFRIAGIVGAFGAGMSLIGGIFAGSRKSAVRMAAAGIVIGLVAVGIPWSWSQASQRVPHIHDITTDMTDPPAFSAVLTDRKDTDNPAAYGGPEVARQQERAYPDIQPLVLPAPPDVIFDQVVSAARDMGWRIVSDDRKQGRIEATATTFWFGFKDDVVVRMKPVKEGTRVDVRSASRVGKSDVGTNAKRVREFLEKMKTAK